MYRESIAAESVLKFSSPVPEPKVSASSFFMPVYRGVKRLIDILVSFLIVTLVLSWLLPILAIIIRIDSKGPVFFVQRRIGYLGIPFKCYKLRTMVMNAESDCMQADCNDARITAVGNFLRKTNLDELPQFFNVLFGNMSLVGPRPFMLKDDEVFSSVVSNYYLRYYAMPGITGMAQMKGCRGKTETDLDIIHRYQWDAFYIRNKAMLLDIKILWVTAKQTVAAIAAAGRSGLAKFRSRYNDSIIVLQVNEAA